MNKPPIKISTFFVLWVFFLLIAFYAVQDLLTSTLVGVRNADRSMVHLSLYLVLVFLGIYYADTVVFRGKNIVSFFDVTLWAIASWAVIANMLNGIYDWTTAVTAGICVLWIFVYRFFQTFLNRWPKTFPHIQCFISLMFIFYVGAAAYAAYAIGKTHDRFAVVNLSYTVMVFLPWILLILGKKLRFIGISLVFLVVLMSMKRGAIIAFPIAMGTYMFVKATVEKRSLIPAARLFGLMVMLTIGLMIVDHWSERFLSSRFSPEQIAVGSGRRDIYLFSIEAISHRPLEEFFIGSGSGSDVSLLGMGIHNEWLSFLFLYGLIGFVLYGLLILALIRQCVRLIKSSSRYAPSYAMALVHILVVGQYSGIYFVHSTFYLMSFFGAVNGLMRNGKQPLPVRRLYHARYHKKGIAR